MSDVFTILPEIVEGQQAFIFDHGKMVDGALKYKDDITSYGWNTKQFNRVEVGAFVLTGRSERGSKGTRASPPQAAQTAVKYSRGPRAAFLRASRQALQRWGSFWKPRSA